MGYKNNAPLPERVALLSGKVEDQDPATFVTVAFFPNTIARAAP